MTLVHVGIPLQKIREATRSDFWKGISSLAVKVRGALRSLEGRVA